MTIFVDGQEYDVSTSARTVIKYWQKYGTSFLDDFQEAARAGNILEVLARLVHCGIAPKVPFKQFKERAERDKQFIPSALALKTLMFISRTKQGKPGPNYGIPNDELTFLARCAIHSIPDPWLDQFTYAQIRDIMRPTIDDTKPCNVPDRDRIRGRAGRDVRLDSGEKEADK